MAETTERTEYRVVGDTAELPPIVPASPFARPATADYGRAKRAADYEHTIGSTNVRIQSRTVTETPWVDLDEKGGERQ